MEKAASPWLRRMEHALVMLPLLLLGARALHSLLQLQEQQDRSTVALLLAAVAAMVLIAVVAIAFEPKHKNAR